VKHCTLTWPAEQVEAERLAALTDLAILDTPPEREFDALVRLAASALGTASAAVSLVDADRQWFKARHGIPFPETPRDISFCTHAVAERAILVVPDALLDARFSANPLVTGPGGIRFYAGVPLILGSGDCIGTLCVFDPVPRRELTASHEAVLTDLSKLIIELIETRRQRRMGEIAANVVQATSDAVIAVDQHGIIIHWNASAERMFGRSRADAEGQNVSMIVPERFALAHSNGFFRAAAGDSIGLVGSWVELVAARSDGEEFPVELSLARWGEGGSDHGFAAIVRDISQRKALERERSYSMAFLNSVVTNLPAMLFVKDSETRQYVTVNRAAELVIGRDASSMVGQTDRTLFPEYGGGYEERDSAAVAAAGKPHVFESAFIRDDGKAVHLRTTRSLIDGPDRPNQYILGVAEDVTEARHAEAQILRLAHYDPLTGLLNRATFTDRLHRLLKTGEHFAMLSIDLDRFKAVNDQYGHPIGDAVLVEVGDRLRGLVRAGDWVARVGGDEFMVVLKGQALRKEAEGVAQRIVAAMARPVPAGRHVAHLGASVGVVMLPNDGATSEQARENVDLALYRAKAEGRSTVCFFDADMDATARDRRTLEKDLRQAVADDAITLAYQPILSAATGRITSAEALARWVHPTRGPIPPDLFIALAEDSDLIDDLGERLLRRACLDAQTWPEDVRIAVNLSPLQFVSGKLPQTVRAALEISKLEPGRLQLEVTESLVIRDVERTFDQLEQLRGLGIQVLIDDFGVGYSSLSYFQRFRFDKVKIDKSFIDAITASHAARAIIQSVVGLGMQLDMGIVAEGVESEEQMRLLVEMGCTHLQGYLFSKPMPLHEFQEKLNGCANDDTASQVRAA